MIKSDTKIKDIDSLKVGFIQYDIKWEDKAANFEKIESILSQELKQDIDILVLPEMFTTGFSMNVDKLAETYNEITYNWLSKISSQWNTAVVGSAIIKDKNHYKNRLLWYSSEGFHEYDKRHLISISKEDRFFKPGTQRKIIEYKGWNIFPSICYDLRFPSWFTNDVEYDIILNVANWPTIRSEHWKVFLKSRAIENQSYIVGVNRIGIDGNGFDYCGNSMIIDYNGNEIINSHNSEGLFISEIKKSDLIKYRKKYPFIKDQDKIKFL
ncbi:MAG: nitrilase-related carbon-nitrogen hydrolase [Saprospiraceae bacterium]